MIGKKMFDTKQKNPLRNKLQFSPKRKQEIPNSGLVKRNQENEGDRVVNKNMRGALKYPNLKGANLQEVESFNCYLNDKGRFKNNKRKQSIPNPYPLRGPHTRATNTF